MERLKITKSITDWGDGESVDRYFKELSNLKSSITQSEEKELAKQIKKGSQIALEKLVKANLRFVVSVAKQYQHQGLPLEDLISEGNLGLIKAAKRFDETKGFKFISYAVWWVRQAILHTLAKDSRIIRLPLNKVGELTKVNKVYNELEKKYDREISIEDVAEEIGEDVNYVSYLRLLSKKHSSLHYVTESDSVSRNGKKIDSDADLLEVLEDKNTGDSDENLMKESLEFDALRCLKVLNQRESDVTTLFFGMNGKMTLDEIAEKFNISRERVRQIKVSAMKKLKKNSETLEKFLS